MSIITKIEMQKNNKNRVNLYLDEEFFMGVSAELVYTHNLTKNLEIDKENLTKLLNDEMFLKAKTKALNIISRCDQSENKLKEKLSKDFEEPIIDKVIYFLKEYALIDNTLLANKLVQDSINLKRNGKKRISFELQKKGLDIDSIEQALETLDTEKELENAIFLAKKREKLLKNKTHIEKYKKIYQHLAYKGYSYDIAKKALDKVLKNIDIEY